MKFRKTYCTTTGISVNKNLKPLCLSFIYGMGKALTGELAWPLSGLVLLLSAHKATVKVGFG